MDIMKRVYKYQVVDSGIEYTLIHNRERDIYIIIANYFGEVGNVWVYDTLEDAERVFDAVSST